MLQQRLIDYDALFDAIYTNPASGSNQRCAQLLDAILNAPFIDPVVYAEWSEVGGTYTCSNCYGQYEKYDHMGYWNGEYQYCPHCGAKMGEGRSK